MLRTRIAVAKNAGAAAVNAGFRAVLPAVGARRRLAGHIANAASACAILPTGVTVAKGARTAAIDPFFRAVSDAVKA